MRGRSLNLLNQKNVKLKVVKSKYYCILYIEENNKKKEDIKIKHSGSLKFSVATWKTGQNLRMT